MAFNYQQLAELLQDKVNHDLIINHVLLGINWTMTEFYDESLATSEKSDNAWGIGLSFSPVDLPRNISWSGTAAGRPAYELVRWIVHENPAAVAVGLATVNAFVNRSDNSLLKKAKPLTFSDQPHLSVFNYFAPKLAGANVVIIGRYPGLDHFKSKFQFKCIERRPGPKDYPESEAVRLIPQADWVFITASSIANKSILELLSLCEDAKIVLMGPSMPWISEWADLGVNYLAGVEIVDPDSLKAIVSEAGGTRIFEEAVRYRVCEL